MEEKDEPTLTQVDMGPKDQAALAELATIRRYVHGIRNMMIVLMVFIIASAAVSICSVMATLALALPGY